jgi:hypothetical protein
LLVAPLTPPQVSFVKESLAQIQIKTIKLEDNKAMSVTVNPYRLAFDSCSIVQLLGERKGSTVFLVLFTPEWCSIFLGLLYLLIKCRVLCCSLSYVGLLVPVVTDAFRASNQYSIRERVNNEGRNQMGYLSYNQKTLNRKKYKRTGPQHVRFSWRYLTEHLTLPCIF